MSPQSTIAHYRITAKLGEGGMGEVWRATDISSAAISKCCSLRSPGTPKRAAASFFDAAAYSTGMITYMRTTISLPEPLLDNARRAARKNGITLSALVEDALRSHMSRDRSSQPSKFRLRTVRGKLVDPAIDLDRTSALVVADDETRFAERSR